MEKRSIQAHYEFLSFPALQNGIESLESWERHAIAMLYAKEIRKGAFGRLTGDKATRLRSFLKHMQSQFVEGANLKLALDFQPRLLATADDLKHRRYPIESVMLYATWCEHWLNGTLISAGLGLRLSEGQVEEMVRSANMPAKLGWLWQLLKLPELPPKWGNAIRFLADVRNEHVHYKWKGYDPDAIAAESHRLTLAVSDIRAVVEGLVDFEISSIVAPYIREADVIFDTDIAPAWRAAALTRPKSAPKLVEDVTPNQALLLARLGHPSLLSLSGVPVKHQRAWSIEPRSRTPTR